MDRYDKIVSRISDCLFEEITYHDNIRTVEQSLLKEYYHALYELVIIPEIKDITNQHMMANEALAYYDVLEVPKQLEPTDILYPTVLYIGDLFRQLKDENKKLVKKSFKITAQEEMKKIQQLRAEYVTVGNQITANEATIKKYGMVMKWSLGISLQNKARFFLK